LPWSGLKDRRPRHAISAALAPEIALAHTDYTASTTINASNGHVWDDSDVFVGYSNGDDVSMTTFGPDRRAWRLGG